MLRFKNKHALIVGGSGGIGSYFSRLLCASGASVTVHGSCDSIKFKHLQQELREILQTTGMTPSLDFLVQNISLEDFKNLDKSPLIERARDTDIIIVCFGPFVQKSVEETSFEDWQKLSLFDYALPGFLTSAALPFMKKKRWGRILLFGGTRTYSMDGFYTNAAYAGAKTGVCSFVRSVATTYAKYGITCNALLPGLVDTEYIESEQKKKLSRKMPTGKLVSAEKIAESGLFLIEHEELNGVLLNVDGGWKPAGNVL
jgi:NAD(P)-dependent dehydrogenase (short-subunit alcohol dehydrogenase family)